MDYDKRRDLTRNPCALGCGCCLIVGACVGIGLGIHAAVGVHVHLRPTQQVLLTCRTENKTINGPGAVRYAPFSGCESSVRDRILLERDDYVHLLDLRQGNRSSRAGPMAAFLGPYETVLRRGFKMRLTTEEYIVVMNQTNGELRVIRGQTAFVPEPEDLIVNRSGVAGSCGSAGSARQETCKYTAFQVQRNQYVVVRNKTDGEVRVIEGPVSFVPAPHDVVQGNIRDATHVLRSQYLVVRNANNGELRTVRGPITFVPNPHDRLEPYTEAGSPPSPPVYLREATLVQRGYYLIVRNRTSGGLRSIVGPVSFVPEPFDLIQGSLNAAYTLQANQYVRLRDTATGAVRREIGPALVYPTPTETPLNASINSGVLDAINVDAQHAVRVLDVSSGQQRLVTSRGRFFPAALEEILEVQQLIRVEPYEVAIVQDASGTYTFHGHATGGLPTNGTDAADASSSSMGTAFFLQPYSRLVTMYWSSSTPEAGGQAMDSTGPAALRYRVPQPKIDLRSQYSSFTYVVRTSDNVELNLEGTVFWQVVDVPRLVSATQDPVLVVYYRARSSLADAVSQVTLETFMAGFGNLADNATRFDVSFYENHGLRLNSLELTSYTPRDTQTAQVLQQIIQETTNRINRLQQQRSQNEVERERLAAEVAQEERRQSLVRARAANALLGNISAQQAIAEVAQLRMAAEIGLEINRSRLVNAQADNDNRVALAAGEAQGVRFARAMSRFFAELTDVLPNASQRLALFQHLNELDTTTRQLNMTTANLGAGNAHLFLTPENLNLRLAVNAASGAPALDDESGDYVLPPPSPPPQEVGSGAVSGVGSG